MAVLEPRSFRRRLINSAKGIFDATSKGEPSCAQARPRARRSEALVGPDEKTSRLSGSYEASAIKPPTQGGGRGPDKEAITPGGDIH